MAKASAAHQKSAVAKFYDKVAAFNVESLFAGKAKVSTPRTVYVNQDLPPDYYTPKGKVRKEHVYANNQVITSKYTILTFLPRNLLEQFRRIANVFFLAIDILQFFPKFSTISPGLVILPLVVILFITALKDGYEDVKRHQSDRRVNHSPIHILEGGAWHNPNEMAKKTRTFTPGRILRRKKKGNAQDSEEREMEIMASADPKLAPGAAGAPPRGVAPRRDSDNSSNPSFIDPASEDSDDPSKPHWEEKIWEDVKVGDFVLLRANDPIPADIIICATSEPESVAFVETKNLDGETNLKSRRAVPELSHLIFPSQIASSNQDARFRIDSEAPEANMYKLHAAVVLANGEKFPIDLQTVLLRGTVLRNTRWVVGVVLFTGADTKIVKNSGGTPSKRSKVERQMNPQVFINLILLLLMAVVCAIVDSIEEKRWVNQNAYWTFMDNKSDDNPSINGLITFANALITFQNVIPISLYISIEFVRTCQAAFIYFDSEIYYEKTDSPTLARSWNLSDDLGQIEYIFSDKTGTLTQNVMVFRQCSIRGKIYKGDEDEETQAILQNSSSATLQRAKGAAKSIGSSTEGSNSDPTIKAITPRFQDTILQADLRFSGSSTLQSQALHCFFTVLSLCHTVLASRDKVTGEIEYKAQSPDEAALVQAAADVGFVFLGRDTGTQTLRLKTPNGEEEWELLNVLDFTSARKRMSVIVRKLGENGSSSGGTGQIWVLCKGADNVIFERSEEGQDDVRDKTEKNLDAFANEGLRTLCLAHKTITNEQYEQWIARYNEASASLENREDNIEQVSDEIERGFTLLGATAIEDKLQDGVPETIADLKTAGIKVWVATGDKLETAVAIGYSTNLIANESNLILIRDGAKSPYLQMLDAVERFFPSSGILEIPEIHPGSALDEEKGELAHSTGSKPRRIQRTNTGVSSIVGHDNGNRPGGFVLVIDGAALGKALAEDYSKELLLQLSTNCEAVICCRVSPLQKAQITRLVKDGLGVLTLAIGDGANDVSMIQAADVGVGISGEEGLQAVNSSDYAIAQFRFLKRLLFVHGHWSYARNANMILNFFYKNIVCIGVLWWFQIYCGWSTTYAFEYTYLLLWNVFWSIAPVIAIGIFDRNIDDDILMKFPELYRYGREGKWFGSGVFSMFMLDGVMQAAVIYFLINYTYWSTSARTDGYQVGLYEFSTTMVISTVMVVNAFNGLNTSAWTGWVWFAVLLGVVLVWGFTAIYSLFSPGLFATPAYGNTWYLFRSAYFWLSIPLTFCVALIPRYIYKAIEVNFFPNDIDILRAIRKRHPERDLRQQTPRLNAPADEEEDAPASPARVLARPTPDSGDTTLPEEEDEDQHTSLPLQRQISGKKLPPINTGVVRGSMTDMSTGTPVANSRGFDFSTEEGGVAMRRIQSNLSENSRRQRGGRGGESSGGSARLRVPPHLQDGEGKRRRGSISLFPNFRASVRRKASALSTSTDHR